MSPFTPPRVQHQLVDDFLERAGCTISSWSCVRFPSMDYRDNVDQICHYETTRALGLGS
jgi:hypothetical protein